MRKPTSAYAAKGATISNAVKAISDASFAWGATDLTDPALSKCTITARLAGVMVTFDGTDPTTSFGHLLAKDTNLVIEGTPNNISRIKFLREAGTDAAVTVTLEH